jgi:hypothetical protein
MDRGVHGFTWMNVGLEDGLEVGIGDDPGLLRHRQHVASRGNGDERGDTFAGS